MQLKLIHIFGWIFIIGALTLPQLSAYGYSPFSQEYVALSAIAVILGVVLGLISLNRIINSCLLFAALLIFSFSYFASPISMVSYPLMGYGISLLIGCICYLSFKFPSKIILILLAGCGAYVLSSAILMPQQFTLVKNLSPPIRNDLVNNRVFHIVLDEHVGLESISEKNIFIQRYTDRGFIVFTNAYSAESFTSYSLARLFNPEVNNPKSIVRDRLSKPSGWNITEARMLEKISKKRDVLVFGQDVVDLQPAIENLPNLIYFEKFSPTNVGPDKFRDSFKFMDRLGFAIARGVQWLSSQFESPLFKAIYLHLPSQFREGGSFSRLFHLSSSFEKLGRLTGSSWYAFVHILLPHSPFIYDEHCQIKPFPEWGSPFLEFSKEWREERIAQNVKQTKCITQHLMSNFDLLGIDVFDKSTFIIHGDHGSRITTQDRPWPKVEEVSEQLGRDVYSTLLAVKLPNHKQGRVVTLPVRIDDVFKELEKQNFQSLDLKSLPKRQSPF
jgi:hypothetical protein